MKQATLKPTTGLHATALLRALKVGIDSHLVDRLDTLIWEFAKAAVGTVEVANLLGQAITCEESLGVGITRSSWQWSAQASLGPLNALLVIDVASAPLVNDGVALRQALVHGNDHPVAVVMVLAITLEACSNCSCIASHSAAMSSKTPKRYSQCGRKSSYSTSQCSTIGFCSSHGGTNGNQWPWKMNMVPLASSAQKW